MTAETPVDVIRYLRPQDPMPWADRAACAGKPQEWWYPEEPGKSVARARLICSTCPVATECLDYALRNHEAHGVWGGCSYKERLRLLRGATLAEIEQARRRKPLTVKPIKHGTYGGYKAHHRRGEYPVCEPCTLAARAAAAVQRDRERALTGRGAA